MARRRIIAGNWKMNMTPSQAVELCATLKDLVKNDAVDVVYCVPAIDIVPVAEAIKGTNVSWVLRTSILKIRVLIPVKSLLRCLRMPV